MKKNQQQLPLPDQDNYENVVDDQDLDYPIIRKQFRRHYKGSPGIIIDGPSQTVPDQTMSIRELIDRFARGLPLGSGQIPLYEGDEEFNPDMKTLDLAEQQELVEQRAEELRELKIKLDEGRKKQRERAIAEARKAMREHYEAIQKEKGEESKPAAGSGAIAP